MTRHVELITGALAGAVGLAVGGPAIGLAAACGGAVISAAGVNRLRQTGASTSIHIDASTRREMESTLHIAIAASWALRPLMESDARTQRAVADALFERIVESYTVEVTPYIQEMQLHLLHVVHSGIMPEASLRHVRRTYAPRFMRKDDSVSFMIARHVLDVQAEHGATVEARDWFVRWCQATGLGKYAQALWVRRFGEHEPPTREEWAAERRRAAAASYFDGDE